MDLKFPRDNAPACLDCGQACIRRVTSKSNTNGNAGRPYYTCLNSTHGRKFTCWDDDRGISSTNPRCECGITSREFAAGGEDFYGCPVGGCKWTIGALDLWSSCSRIEEAFGSPIVFDFGAQGGQGHNNYKPPVEIKIGSDFQWKVTTDSGGSPLCSICCKALEELRGPEVFVSADVSPEIRSRAGCHLCTLFVHSAKRRGSAIKTQELAQVCKYGFEPMDLGQCTLYLLWREPGERNDSHQVCHMSDIGCLPSTIGNSLATEVESFQKSITLARQWIQRCDTAHPSCQNEKATSFIPSRVIDVGEKKIFHSLIKPVLRNGKDIPPGSSYLTLSHCWGGVKFLCLLKSNISSMMEHIPFDALPKTFQDAIIVAQTLGVRYIWIDSLCIIQDDIEDWRYEAALMSEVYKYGTCNISATGAANGTVGLLFDHNHIFTKPVKAQFTTNGQGPMLHDFWQEGLLGSIDAEPLQDRGWVLQERLLSRRNLHFSRNQVIWECRTNSACETFPDKTPFKETPQFMKHRFSQVVYSGDRGPQSLTEVWSFLVSQYTKCKLTKATDKLVAFGGIAKTFNEPLGRHYVGGIWLENLVYQLCWTGKRGTGNDYVAPSWSWASTEGPVNHIFLPVHSTHLVRELEILEAHVDLVNQLNPFGEVRSGHLRVASCLAMAKIVFDNDEATRFVRNERQSVLLLPDTVGIYRPTREKIDLSWSEEDISEAQRRPGISHLYLMAVMEHVDAEREYLQGLAGKLQMDPRRAPRTRWLILCPVENQVGTFTRCGTITADDSSYGIFAQACRWYDQTAGHLPVHSNESQTGARYIVTII